ncbi:glycoside hydrolase family 25 protein [Rhizobium sp. SAFR-030]|uniref:glycoside hydrolase family 25 protein n=1 Tax=Rhizobium sp. SAFR-030 TaxID=3387277 RepID=UPI003F7D8BC7
MRSSLIPAILVGCLVIGGCRSSGPEEALTLAPSQEITSAVSPVTPPGSIGSAAPQVETAAVQEAADQARPAPHELAWSGNVPQPQSFQTGPMDVGMPVPSNRPVAMLVPDAPDLRGPSGKRERVYSQRFRDAKPMNFGRITPRHHPVHGVDVSRWQGNIDWPKLRTEGANFAYIKATDGGDHLDPMFKTNWQRAKAAGVKRGAYHFFYWCRVASEQAEWFIRNVPNDPDALPPVIDVEYNHQSDCKRRLSPEKIREKMQVFMDTLERHYGKRPLIYTAPDFYKDNLQTAFPNHPFWLRSVAAHPSKIYPGRNWVLWQYSGSGLSQGVNEKIDLNVFYGSAEQWYRWSTARPGSQIATR